MVCDAFRVSALCDSMDLLRHDELLLLDNLEVTDNIDSSLWGDEGKLVELAVFEELVGDLYDALLSEELACKVDTYCNLALNAFEVEDVQCLVYVFSGNVVQYGAIFQCADYQFFSCHDLLFLTVSQKV